MERGVLKIGQNLPMERCKKLLACGCGVKTPEKILTSFMDDPLPPRRVRHAELLYTLQCHCQSSLVVALGSQKLRHHEVFQVKIFAAEMQRTLL